MVDVNSVIGEFLTCSRLGIGEPGRIAILFQICDASVPVGIVRDLPCNSKPFKFGEFHFEPAVSWISVKSVILLHRSFLHVTGTMMVSGGISDSVFRLEFDLRGIGNRSQSVNVACG